MTTTGRGEHDTETRAGEAEAVEAAAIRLGHYSAAQWERWSATPTAQTWLAEARAAVTAAYPIIAAAVRAEHGEQIAQRIEAETTRPDDEHYRWWRRWLWNRGFHAGWNGRGEIDARLAREAQS